MYTAYAVVTLVTIAINIWASVIDFIPTRSVLANSERVDVPRSWLVPLGLLKGAGAVGLLLGLLGVEPIGIAAAAGLVLFFIGAVVAHIRARALSAMAFPGFFLAAATASLALTLAT